ncbi:MAG: GNAT family N-acetyltransferase [Anaerolineae bacterium]
MVDTMVYEIKQVTPEDAIEWGILGDITQQPALGWYSELVSGNRIIFLCYENEACIGQGALVFDKNDPDYTIPGRRVYLSRLIVSKEYRHRGIGGRLVDVLVDYASSLGYQEMTVGVDLDNSAARHLYAKKGFTTVLYEGEDESGKYVKLLKTL